MCSRGRVAVGQKYVVLDWQLVRVPVSLVYKLLRCLMKSCNWSQKKSCLRVRAYIAVNETVIMAEAAVV